MSRRTPLTRRDFVKSAAGAAAAAIAFPTIIPSSALGNADRPPPSERLNMGFIGIGKMGQGHLDRFLGTRGVMVVAVSDVHAARRQHAKELTEKRYAEYERRDFRGCEQYTDYRELLARNDIDAVVICSPDHWHTAQLIEACKAGKDIYCEKPLTLTIGEAKAAIDAVRKHDRVFQTGSQQRSEGPFREVVDYIRNGRLGKLREVHVGIGPTSKPCDLPGQPVPQGVEWDMWLGQAPQREYNEVLCRDGLPDTYPFNPGWRDYREYSGGYVTDWGAHHFDITHWALDKDTSGPDEIHPPERQGATYGAKMIYRGSPVGDEVTVFHDEMENGIRFVGERGEIFVNRGEKRSNPESILAEPLPEGDRKVFYSPGHHQNWLDCIRSRQRPICDVEVGARSVTACHLVNLAYWNHRKLNWDPAQWQFTGEGAEEANRWRHRERRANYPLPEA